MVGVSKAAPRPPGSSVVQTAPPPIAVTPHAAPTPAPLEVYTLGTGGAHPGTARLPSVIGSTTGRDAQGAGATLRAAGVFTPAVGTPRFQVKFSTPDASFDSTKVTLFKTLVDAAPKSRLKPATDAQVRALAKELTANLPGLFSHMRQWLREPNAEPPDCPQQLGDALKQLATQPMVATVMSDGQVAPGMAVKVGLKALGLSGRLLDTGDLAKEGPELLGFLNEALPILLGQMASIGSFTKELNVEDLLPRVNARMVALWMGYSVTEAQARTLQTSMDAVTPSYAKGVPEFFAARTARGTFDESFSAMALAMTKDLSHAMETLEDVRGRVNPSTSFGWLRKLFS